MKWKNENKSGFDDDFIEWVKYPVFHVGVAEQAVNPPHPCLYEAASNPKNKIYKESEVGNE